MTCDYGICVKLRHEKVSLCKSPSGHCCCWMFVRNVNFPMQGVPRLEIISTQHRRLHSSLELCLFQPKYVSTPVRHDQNILCFLPTWTIGIIKNACLQARLDFRVVGVNLGPGGDYFQRPPIPQCSCHLDNHFSCVAGSSLNHQGNRVVAEVRVGSVEHGKVR